LIKYETRREAQLAVDEANNTKFLGQAIQVDFAFGKGPEDGTSGNRNYRRSDRRSISPA
jgi:RNA-binding protein 8A